MTLLTNETESERRAPGYPQGASLLWTTYAERAASSIVGMPLAGILGRWCGLHSRLWGHTLVVALMCSLYYCVGATYNFDTLLLHRHQFGVSDSIEVNVRVLHRTGAILKEVQAFQ